MHQMTMQMKLFSSCAATLTMTFDFHHCGRSASRELSYILAMELWTKTYIAERKWLPNGLWQHGQLRRMTRKRKKIWNILMMRYFIIKMPYHVALFCLLVVMQISLWYTRSMSRARQSLRQYSYMSASSITFQSNRPHRINVVSKFQWKLVAFCYMFQRRYDTGNKQMAIVLWPSAHFAHMRFWDICLKENEMKFLDTELQ